MKNFYFETSGNRGEQRLIEDLIIESIRIYGIDLWYMPRTVGALDDVLNEDNRPVIDKALLIECYVRSVDGFDGDGDFLSKFGLTVRDSLTITVAKRVYEQDVALETNHARPMEGDYVFLPLNGKVFEVKHVEHEAIFYQMGSLQTYDLRLETFEYNHETFATGVPEIDTLFKSRTPVDDSWASLEETDSRADNTAIEDEADTILDFTETNPFGMDDY